MIALPFSNRNSGHATKAGRFRRGAQRRQAFATALPAMAMATLLLASCTSSSTGEAAPPSAPSSTGSTGSTVVTGTAVAAGPTTFVGAVDGTPLAVAAVVDRDRLVFYVCDGQNGRRSEGTLGPDGFRTDVEGLGPITVKRDGAALTGALEVGATSYPLHASPATGKAALLWASGDNGGAKVSAGWIVAPDGSETGGVVAGITDGTSNIVLAAGARPHVAQDGIIAILIGVRAPLVRVP